MTDRTDGYMGRWRLSHTPICPIGLIRPIHGPIRESGRSPGPLPYRRRLLRPDTEYFTGRFFGSILVSPVPFLSSMI